MDRDSHVWWTCLACKERNRTERPLTVDRGYDFRCVKCNRAHTSDEVLAQQARHFRL